MIIKSNKKILNSQFNTKNYKPFDKKICQFISELSKLLIKKYNPREFPDIYTFAFFCRDTNIRKIKDNFYKSNQIKKSLGLIFHIPPNNIPTNFAYSFIFSLLLGNTNIVRVSSKLLDLSGKLIFDIDNLMKKKFNDLYDNNFFLFYERINEINEHLCMKCDGRMIWGGDKTVNYFKKIQTALHTKDIIFYDRYSICVINSNYINQFSKKDLVAITKKFYNDTYLVDQAACSSPILINWIGNNIKKAKVRFWSTLLNLLKQKDYQKNFLEFLAIDKDVDASINFAINRKFILNYESYENLINLINLKKIPKNINNFKGKFGLFYQHDLKKLSNLTKSITRNCQTMTYLGFEKKEIYKFLNSKSLRGIDRAITIGGSLDMNIIWDGIDLRNALTRNITII